MKVFVVILLLAQVLHVFSGYVLCYTTKKIKKVKINIYSNILFLIGLLLHLTPLLLLSPSCLALTWIGGQTLLNMEVPKSFKQNHLKNNIMKINDIQKKKSNKILPIHAGMQWPTGSQNTKHPYNNTVLHNFLKGIKVNNSIYFCFCWFNIGEY